MFEIIFNHQDFIVANKLPGLSFHSEHVEGFHTLLQKQLNIKLFSIHRLDKGTSGIIVFAKNKASAKKLSELWQMKKVQKYYLALSDLSPKKKQGTIKGDMEKSRRGSYKITRSFHNPAITQFVTVSLRPGLRMYLCRPITGKTHQIRVALKANGSPILGDARYGGNSSDRLYLHSYALSFEYDGKNFEFKCVPNQGEEFQKDYFNQGLEHFNMPEKIVWPKA